MIFFKEKFFKKNINVVVLKMGTICIETTLFMSSIWCLILFAFSSYLIFVVTPSYKVRDLCLASSQWSNASIEDKDPMTKLIHASFGLAFFNAAKHISSEKDIFRLTGIRSKEFLDTLKENLKFSLQSAKALHDIK